MPCSPAPSGGGLPLPGYQTGQDPFVPGPPTEPRLPCPIVWRPLADHSGGNRGARPDANDGQSGGVTSRILPPARRYSTSLLLRREDRRHDGSSSPTVDPRGAPAMNVDLFSHDFNTGPFNWPILSKQS